MEDSAAAMVEDTAEGDTVAAVAEGASTVIFVEAAAAEAVVAAQATASPLSQGVDVAACLLFLYTANEKKLEIIYIQKNLQ